MAAWLEDLVADERWYLVKEMKENRDEDGRDDPVRMAEVRLCEKVLKFIRGSMEEAGWDTTTSLDQKSPPTTTALSPAP
jgi:hypothetical protein